MDSSQFNELTPAELILIQQHLKLGEKHLKKLLSRKELQTLFSVGEQEQEGSKQMPHDPREISGNVSLVLNTIFTACFGAWMGFSGFWGLELHSKPAFFSVAFLALSLGAFVGYQTIKMTRSRALADIHTQQLHQLQLLLLRKIREKREEEIASLKTHITHSLSQLDNLGGIKPSLERDFEAIVEEHGMEPIHPENSRTLPPLIQKLIHQPAKESLTPKSWVREHFRELVTSLIPTFLGGFSSLFVYLGGGPEILKTLGYSHLLTLMTSPQLKPFQFALSCLMTTTLAMSSFHSNRNSFRRQQELEKTEKQIIEEQASLTVLDAKLQKLKELKVGLDKTLETYALMTKID
jgi:hypothetical protein